MKQEALVHFDLTYLNTLAMLLFLGVFVAVMIRVFRKSTRAHYQMMSRFPLESTSSEEEVENVE